MDEPKSTHLPDEPIVRHVSRVVAVLLLFVLAAMGRSGFGDEPDATDDPPRFRVRIEGGAAEAVSAPSSLDLTMGWRHPCVLEVENRDAVRREVTLEATLPVRIVLPEARIVLEPNQTRAVPFLLQTLTLEEHEARLAVGAAGQECTVRVRINPRADPAGVRFGVLDHFEREGPITAMLKQPGGAGKPPKPKPGGEAAPPGTEKDLSQLTVAPTEAVGERVLDAMRQIQDLGCQTFRMDMSWRIVEQTPGVFAWDRNDWMTNALRSPQGAGCRIVSQIGYQPQWLPRDFPTTRKGRQAYSRWVENVVSRYADRVDTWEIWNEPLLFWLRHPDHKPDKREPPTKPLSAQETEALADSYARMILEIISTASKIIRQRDPEATILSPGFADFLNAPGPVFPEFARLVHTRLLSGGMAKHVDGFCIHSYPAGYPGKAPRLDDPQPWRKFDQAADTGRLMQMLTQHNVRLPLYCTEFGGFQLSRKASVEDETAAALALLRNGCILAHQGFRLVTYYELYDWDEKSLTYLVQDKDRRRTRGYSTYQRLIAALAGAAPCEVPQIPQTRVYDSDYSGLVIKSFRRGSEDILCLWSNAATSCTVQLRTKPPAAGDAPILEHVRFSPEGDFLTEKAWGGGDAGSRDVELTVAPLEFHILSRTSSVHGFDWLVKADVSALKK